MKNWIHGESIKEQEVVFLSTPACSHLITFPNNRRFTMPEMYLIDDKVCLYQMLYSDKYPIVKVEGVGNCYECTPHPDNKYCKKYCPVSKFTQYVIKYD